MYSVYNIVGRTASLSPANENYFLDRDASTWIAREKKIVAFDDLFNHFCLFSSIYSMLFLQ